MFEEIIKKLNKIFYNNEKILKNIVDDFNQIKTRKNKVSFYRNCYLFITIYRNK
jgi:hypothetical protein